MKAVMLAAGVGSRLERSADAPPKILLEFAGRSLLARHVELLAHAGVGELVLGVGHRAGEIEAEIDRLGARDFVRTVTAANYRRGAIQTLWALADEFRAAEGPVLLMDGDVLYDHRIAARLAARTRGGRFLIDRHLEPGDDPVKLCVRDGRIVDFHKRPTDLGEWRAEWIGFLQLSREAARKLPEYLERYVDGGEPEVIYEQPIRDLVIEAGPDAFGYEDITGLPWIEIDFPEDLQRAEGEIQTLLEETPEWRKPSA